MPQFQGFNFEKEMNFRKLREALAGMGAQVFHHNLYKFLFCIGDMTKLSADIQEVEGKEALEKAIVKGVVIADFWADWCMPCLMMAPVFEEMAEKFKGKISFVKVNVDDNQKLAEKFKVQSIPTTIAFKNGKEHDRMIGAMYADDFEDFLKKQL